MEINTLLQTMGFQFDNPNSIRETEINAAPTGINYIGTAPRGSATIESKWQVAEITVGATPTTISVRWSEGLKKWSDRASLTYT